MQPRHLLKTAFTKTPTTALLMPQQLGTKSRAYALTAPLHPENSLYPLISGGQVGPAVYQTPRLKPYSIKTPLLLFCLMGCIAFVGGLIIYPLLALGLVTAYWYLCFFLKNPVRSCKKVAEVLRAWDVIAVNAQAAFLEAPVATTLSIFGISSSTPLTPLKERPLSRLSIHPTPLQPPLAALVPLAAFVSSQQTLILTAELGFLFKTLEREAGGVSLAQRSHWFNKRRGVLISHEPWSSLILSPQMQIAPFSPFDKQAAMAGIKIPTHPFALIEPQIGLNMKALDSAYVEVFWLWAIRPNKPLMVFNA